MIAHGSQYGASLQEIAPEFPDVSFAWGTAGDTFGLDNVYAYEAASDQGGYVMGVMAAGLSKSGIIGVVGPIEVGDAALYVNGFIAGADSAGNRNGRPTRADFSDVALASQTAQAFIAAGADVLSGTAQMVTGAVSVAEDDGIPWFGTQSNQTELAPDIVVASQVYHWEVVLSDILANLSRNARWSVLRDHTGERWRGHRVQRRFRPSRRREGCRRGRPAGHHRRFDLDRSLISKQHTNRLGRPHGLPNHPIRKGPTGDSTSPDAPDARHHQEVPGCACQRPRRLRSSTRARYTPCSARTVPARAH